MPITYDAPSETISVTGGSWDNPYTAADIASDPTAGTYVSTGGYGNKVYTFSANLVLGSEAEQTFFDIVGSVLKCDSGYSMSIYASAIRGGNSDFTWAAKTFGACLPVPSEACKMLTTGVLKAYVQTIGIQCETEGYTVDLGVMGAPAGVAAMASCATGGALMPGACPVCVPPCPTAEPVPVLPFQEVIPFEQIIPLTEVIPRLQLLSPVQQVQPRLEQPSEAAQLKSRIVLVFADSEVL